MTYKEQVLENRRLISEILTQSKRITESAEYAGSVSDEDFLVLLKNTTEGLQLRKINAELLGSGNSNINEDYLAYDRMRFVPTQDFSNYSMAAANNFEIVVNQNLDYYFCIKQSNTVDLNDTRLRIIDLGLIFELYEPTITQNNFIAYPILQSQSVIFETAKDYYFTYWRKKDNNTLTSLSLNTNILSYVDEKGNTNNIDLSLYLDDTNLALVTSGTYDDVNQELVFTRDDGSTFTIDASLFFDNTNLVLSVNGKTGAVALTKADIGLGDVVNGAQPNVRSDWNQTDELADDFIKNKPTDLGGTGVESTVDNGDGTITFNYTDGSSFTTINLIGPPGNDGDYGLSAFEVWRNLGNTGDQQDFIDSLIGPQGPQGERGSGIASTQDNGDGTITYTYDDGSTFTTSNLIGPQGPAGEDGAIGPQGPQGIPGEDGVAIGVGYATLVSPANEIDMTDPNHIVYNRQAPTSEIVFTLTNMQAGRTREIEISNNTNGAPETVTINGTENNRICSTDNWSDTETMIIYIECISATNYEWWYYPKQR